LIQEQSLFDYVNKLEVSGLYEFKVNERVGKRSAHTAKLEIRFGEIEIKKSKSCNDPKAPPSIKLRVVDVKEIADTVIGTEEPIHWCLLTTHEVTNSETALQIVKWYCQRWNIEQLFRTLKKQGINVESSQVETGEGLIKLAILALYAALQTMQLTLAREGKDQLISVVFSKKECDVLKLIQEKVEGKTEKQKNPHKPEQLSWAAWTIARLGGWKGYQSESPPGPITMLRGLRHFQLMIEGYQLAKKMCA
jgi:transposase